jgi:hypothetical protein
MKALVVRCPVPSNGVAFGGGGFQTNRGSKKRVRRLRLAGNWTRGVLILIAGFTILFAIMLARRISEIETLTSPLP